jgi:hypothetical protein
MRQIKIGIVYWYWRMRRFTAPNAGPQPGVPVALSVDGAGMIRYGATQQQLRTAGALLPSGKRCASFEHGLFFITLCI